MKTEELSRRLHTYPDILAAYLFGSAARKAIGPLSDVDVAILLNFDTPYSKTLSLICDVGSDIQELYRKEGDVKILNRIDDLPFLYEILSTGTLIFEREPEVHRAFVAQSIMKYLDFKPSYDKMVSGYRRSLRNGKTGIRY